MRYFTAHGIRKRTNVLNGLIRLTHTLECAHRGGDRKGRETSENVKY